MESPENRNHAAIRRLEQLLAELRASPSTAREPEAIREMGLELALAVREVGAMLVDVAWEATLTSDPRAHGPRARD